MHTLSVNVCADRTCRMDSRRALLVLVAASATSAAAASTGAQERSPLSLIPAPVFLILVAVVHVVCIFVGRKELQRIAASWCTAFAGPQGILSRNFAVWGSMHMSPPDSQLFWQTNPATFKIWCSGRRHCTGALFTLGLRKRHNLFNNISNLVKRGEDLLQVEVFLSPGALPTSLFAIGSPRLIKAILKDKEGGNAFPALATQLAVSKERLPGFPTEDLAVAAEHSSVFYDIFTDTPAAQLFARGGSAHLAARYLQSLVYNPEVATPAASSAEEDKEAAMQAPLVFTFRLPPATDMEDLQPLMMLVFVLVDVIAAYKLPPAAKQRAQEARAKLAQEAMKATIEARKEELQQKKQMRIMAERAKAARAGPEALAKFEEQRQRQMQKKAMRSRVKIVS